MQTVNGQQKPDPSLMALINKLRQQREMHADEAANLHVQLAVAHERIKELESEIAQLTGSKAA